MKRSTLLLFCFLIWGTTNAIAQDAVPAAGTEATGAGGTVNYTVGQVLYSTETSGSGNIQQGVQQPYVVIATDVNNNSNISIDISVFPNPSTTFLQLNIELANFENISFQLYDVQGKLLLQQKITGKQTAILMNEYATGNYFLKVLDQSNELKAFKIIKN